VEWDPVSALTAPGLDRPLSTQRFDVHQGCPALERAPVLDTNGREKLGPFGPRDLVTQRLREQGEAAIASMTAVPSSASDAARGTTKYGEVVNDA
jgi:hypothetical protein